MCSQGSQSNGERRRRRKRKCNFWYLPVPDEFAVIGKGWGEITHLCVYSTALLQVAGC